MRCGRINYIPKTRANLIKSRENVVRELNFGDCSVTHGSKTYSKTCNALFRERGIEYAFLAWQGVSVMVCGGISLHFTELFGKPLLIIGVSANLQGRDRNEP